MTGSSVRQFIDHLSLRAKIMAGHGRSLAIVLAAARDIVGDFPDIARPPAASRTPAGVDNWLDGPLDEHQLPPSATPRREMPGGAPVEIDSECFRRVMFSPPDNAVHAMTESGWSPPDDARHIAVGTAAAGSMTTARARFTVSGLLSAGVRRTAASATAVRKAVAR